MDLTGQSLFDFIHHKDINKVKEQLASSDQHQLNDAASESEGRGRGGGFQRRSPSTWCPCLSAAEQTQTDAPVRPSFFTSGARRAFFFRMKYSQVTGKHELLRIPKKGECLWMYEPLSF